MSYESETALYRIARGGGWNWTFSGSASTRGYDPSFCYGNSGFRVVKKVKLSSRVGRGGCWFSSAENCRSAYRGWDEPSCRDGYRGFRVVKEVKPLVKEVEPPDREIRGGGWNDSAEDCRSAYRYWYGLSGRYGNLGFRVFKEINNDK